MPYSNVPDDPELQAKMERCVKEVQAKQPGLSKESAVAICYTSVVGESKAAKIAELFRLSTTEPDPVLRKQYAEEHKAAMAQEEAERKSSAAKSVGGSTTGMGEPQGDDDSYELFDHYARAGFQGHTGPFVGLQHAIEAATRRLKGDRSADFISIRLRDQQGKGGYDREVARVSRDREGNISVDQQPPYQPPTEADIREARQASQTETGSAATDWLHDLEESKAISASVRKANPAVREVVQAAHAVINGLVEVASLIPGRALMAEAGVDADDAKLLSDAIYRAEQAASALLSDANRVAMKGTTPADVRKAEEGEQEPLHRDEFQPVNLAVDHLRGKGYDFLYNFLLTQPNEFYIDDRVKMPAREKKLFESNVAPALAATQKKYNRPSWFYRELADQIAAGKVFGEGDVLTRKAIDASMQKGTLWTQDYATGETICAVCGEPKGNKTRCCNVAPYVSFEDFVRRYFGPDFDLSAVGNGSTAREFYDDYRHSNAKSLADYKRQTSEQDYTAEPEPEGEEESAKMAKAEGGEAEGIPTVPPLKRRPQNMTASEINRALDAYEALDSRLNQALIDAGHGDWHYGTDIPKAAKSGHPLAQAVQQAGDILYSLRSEIKARTGSNATFRLPPGRGFGPRHMPGQMPSENA